MAEYYDNETLYDNPQLKRLNEVLDNMTDEELARRGGHMKQILDMADFLIDGPYVENLRDITLEMRGSSNQRIINLREIDKD